MEVAGRWLDSEPPLSLQLTETFMEISVDAEGRILPSAPDLHLLGSVFWLFLVLL